MQAIDLSQYRGYNALFLRVKEPDFDAKQPIYPLLRSSSTSNPQKGLAEIVGFTLRELLNQRTTLFLNGKPCFVVQLVDQNMKMQRQAIIQERSTNYSNAEAALRDPLPQLSPPPPAGSRPPSVRKMRGDLLLGFAVFLIVAFIGLAYFNREAFRTWRS